MSLKPRVYNGAGERSLFVLSQSSVEWLPPGVAQSLVFAGSFIRNTNG